MSTAPAIDDFDESDLEHAHVVQPRSLLENPDVDLPIPEHARHRSGCLGLLVAILQDLFAARDQFRKHKPGIFHGYKRTQLDRDRAWLNSESKEPFSLVWICEHLGYDVDAVRRRYREGRPMDKRLKLCARCRRVHVSKGFKLCAICTSRYVTALRAKGVPLSAKHKVTKDEKVK